jgi:hypothetical protein
VRSTTATRLDEQIQQQEARIAKENQKALKKPEPKLSHSTPTLDMNKAPITPRMLLRRGETYLGQSYIQAVYWSLVKS